MILFFIVVCAVLSSSTAENDMDDNGTQTKKRDGRWFTEDEPRVSVQLGYYIPSSPPAYPDDDSGDNEDGSGDKIDQNFGVPTSFNDFKPDMKQSKKKPAKFPKDGPYKSGPAKWNGYYGDYDYNGAWQPPIPSDITAMINAMQGGSKPTGLLDKLISSPLVAITALVPLAILLAAVLPSIFGYFMNMNIGTPTVATTATGNNGRKNDPSLIATVAKAIEKFSSLDSYEPACLRKAVCEATKYDYEAEFKTAYSIYKALNITDNKWLTKFGLMELIEALGNGKCENIDCASDKDHLKKKDD